MNRSLVLPAVLLLSGLIGCRAQDDRRNLQNSVTRLEQRLQRMDEYLRSLQQGEVDKRQAQERLAGEREAEVRNLREQLARLERESQERLAAQERAMVELERQRAQIKDQTARQLADVERQFAEERARLLQQLEAERAALRAEVQQAHQAAADEVRRATEEHQERLRAELGRRQIEHGGLFERLAAERREVEELRASVQQEVARVREATVTAERRNHAQQEELQGLRVQNERLRRRVADLELELEHSRQQAQRREASAPTLSPGPAPGGSEHGAIIVNNAEGEVHIHIHGQAPQQPRAALRTTTPPRAVVEPQIPTGSQARKKTDAAERKLDD